MRKLNIKDFTNAFEYEQAVKALRKGDKLKRVSSTGRRSFQSGEEE